MKTKKTRQKAWVRNPKREGKLKEDRDRFMILFIVAFIGFGVFFVWYLIDDVKINNLETQLSECQEQVPVWTLKIECYQTNLSYSSWNLFGTNVIWDRYVFETNFTSYKDYQERLDWYEDYDKKWKEVKDCEVIE